MPFNGNSHAVLFESIRQGEFKMHEDFTDDLKDLLKNMLNVDFHKRFTASQCLEHPWIKQNLKQVKYEKVTPELASNLAGFQPPSRLKKRTL